MKKRIFRSFWLAGLATFFTAIGFSMALKVTAARLLLDGTLHRTQRKGYTPGLKPGGYQRQVKDLQLQGHGRRIRDAHYKTL